MDKKNITFLILKSAKQQKRNLIKKQQEEYLKPFKEKDKVWTDIAIEYIIDFILELESIFNEYKNECIKVLNDKMFVTEIKKAKKPKKYKTYEYLDSLYNKVIVSDIKDTLIEIGNSFKDALKSTYDKFIKNGVVKNSAKLIFENMNMLFDFNKFDKKTRDYLRDKKIKWAKEVAETTEKSIKRQLVKGYQKGLSTYDIAENIKKETGFSLKRCEAIARTEIISSCNYTEYTAIKENPDTIGYKWSSSGNNKVRPTHQIADGQIRKKDEPFDVGNSKLLFPGDSSLGASAGEIVNCRCAIYPIFEGEMN